MEKEFTELIAQYRYALQKICNTYFYRDPYAEDFMQEIIIRLWKAYPFFRGESSVKTWLYRVAINTSIDIIRKRSLSPRFLGLSPKDYDRPPGNDGTDNDYADKMRHAVNRLSDNDKALVIMYLDEFSYQEIAGVTGLSVNHVGVKLNRIRKQLKTLIENGNE